MDENDAVGALVDERELRVLDQDREGQALLGPQDGAEMRRHQRSQRLGLVLEGGKKGRGKAKTEGAAGFEVVPPRPQPRAEQPAHHKPEGAGVELLEIDGVEMHAPS